MMIRLFSFFFFKCLSASTILSKSHLWQPLPSPPHSESSTITSCSNKSSIALFFFFPFSLPVAILSRLKTKYLYTIFNTIVISNHRYLMKQWNLSYSTYIMMIMSHSSFFLSSFSIIISISYHIYKICLSPFVLHRVSTRFLIMHFS